MGGGGGGDSEIRYAPYLERAHGQFLNHGGSDSPDVSFVEAFNNVLDSSPYSTYTPMNLEEGFFGISVEDAGTTYEIKNFPSLWDMFGKFVGGLDLHDLWGEIYEDVIRGPEIENAVSAHAEVLQDQIDTNVMPKFLAGMRDINAVQSSAFVIGKSIIQDAHVKSVNDFAAKIRVNALSVANQQWAKHLDWNQSTISTFANMFKLYYAAKTEIEPLNYDFLRKDTLWNIKLFDNARNMLGAMQGNPASTEGEGPSQTQKSVGGALAGAAMGYQVGGPYGAVVGGVLGLAASFL